MSKFTIHWTQGDDIMSSVYEAETPELAVAKAEKEYPNGVGHFCFCKGTMEENRWQVIKEIDTGLGVEV